jgi:ribonuclease III family protein
MDNKNTLLRPELSPFGNRDIRQTKPLVLAFIGDSIYELYVRNYVSGKMDTNNVNKLHNATVRYVKAISQAAAVRELMKLEILSEEESAWVRRGRNQYNSSVPKSASVVEYKLATGFECLVGYLYLSGDYSRLDEIVMKALDIIEKLEEQQ